jgi:Membrane bound beta barrel domain (DUF5777)
MKQSKAIVLLLLFCSGITVKTYAQEDLLSMLGDDDKNKKEFVTNAFKSTRIINTQSVEHLGKGVLDVRILHRFGQVNTGLKEFFGLDQANMRLGFDYGVTNRLMVGVGRSNNSKELDGYLKYRLIWQAKGAKAYPFSLDIVSGTTLSTISWADPTRKNYFSSRMSYYHQALIARKFSDAFTLQLSPTFVHRNLVTLTTDPNDVFSLGFGGRVKLNRRLAFNWDYQYVLRVGDVKLSDNFKNSLSVGFDIETGGHVFQLHFTNSLGMNEPTVIAKTTGDWGNGDIHFGFNLSRVFTVRRPKTNL